MRLAGCVVLIAAMGGHLMASPAHPVAQTQTRLLVVSAELVEIPPPPGDAETGGTPRALLGVEGRPLDEEASIWPDELRFQADVLSARLAAATPYPVRPDAVITVINVDHSVHRHEPTHHLEDILTPADRANGPLMAVARRNPGVRILDLNRLEEVLIANRAEYMDRGYATLAEWEIALDLEAHEPASPLVGRVYRASFFPTTGRVNAEWTLDVDLDARTVSNQVIWTEEAAPDPPDPDE